MTEFIASYAGLSEDTVSRLLKSVVILLVLWTLRYLSCWLARSRISDLARYYHWRRSIGYTIITLSVVLIGRVWIEGIDSIATFLGLTGAGLAIALRDTISNIAGWAYIVLRKPFEVGDRIQVGSSSGDVIDIRVFQFSMIEIGNWVDADQNTGRIIHVPNNKALSEPIANYETGFAYIWHEIPVLITFESDWEKAKQILTKIVYDKAERLSDGAEQQIRRAAMTYLIFFSKLTPIVYTTVRNSGVLLTLRYIVKPRERRGSESTIWEAILQEFAKHEDVNLAYPTTRFYRQGEKHEAPHD